MALAVAAPNTVRGTAWLDNNGDGIRQLWETPLAGVLVTATGQTAVTDADGRYSFYGIAPGTYSVVAQLPNGLTAQIGPAVVSNERGAVVGIAAVEGSGIRVYLPVVVRP